MKPVASDCKAVLGFDPPPYRLPYEQMRTDYGIGLIGLHWVMQIMHLPAYRSAGYRIAAACDIMEDRIRETQSKGYDIGRIERDWKKVIRLDDVHVLDCTFGHKPGRQEHRLEVVEEAAGAGKHLMIHKPVASSLALAERMAAAAQDGGIRLAVNQDCRYNPAAYCIKQLLDPQRLGQAAIIEVQNYWKGKPPSLSDDRNAWVGHVIHHADLIRWWVGAPCVSVYARTGYLSTMALYEFANGTVAYHMENHAGVNEHETYARIVTERGVIRAGMNWNWHVPSAAGREFVEVHRDAEAPVVHLPLPEHIYEPVWSDVNPFIPRTGPYYDLGAPIAGMMGTMGSLMQGVAESRPPDNAIEGAIESLRMCLATELSGESGRAVNPAEIDTSATAKR